MRVKLPIDTKVNVLHRDLLTRASLINFHLFELSSSKVKLPLSISIVRTLYTFH